MDLSKKFLIEEILKLRKQLESIPYYKYSAMGEVYRIIKEHIQKANSDRKFDETLEAYIAKIKQLIDEMPEYLTLSL